MAITLLGKFWTVQGVVSTCAFFHFILLQSRIILKNLPFRSILIPDQPCFYLDYSANRYFYRTQPLHSILLRIPNTPHSTPPPSLPPAAPHMGRIPKRHTPAHRPSPWRPHRRPLSRQRFPVRPRHPLQNHMHSQRRLRIIPRPHRRPHHPRMEQRCMAKPVPHRSRRLWVPRDAGGYGAVLDGAGDCTGE